MNLEELGITKEDLQERVVERICDIVLRIKHEDEDGDIYFSSTSVRKELDKKIKETVDAGLNSLFQKEVAPVINKKIEIMKL